MNIQSFQYSLLDSLTGVIRVFLAAPPVGISTEVISAVIAFNKALENNLKNNNVILPPSLFYEVVEQANIAISITDLQANVLYANPAFEQVTGYHLAEIIGKNESLLSNKTTSPLVYEDLWKCLRQQHPWSSTLLNKRKDGSSYLAEVNIAPVLNVNNQTTYYLAMHRDVTEVRRLEQQVQRQKTLIESMVDSAPVVIVLLEETGKIVLANQKYKKLATDLQEDDPLNSFLKAIKSQLSKKWANRHSFTNFEVPLPLDWGGHDQPRWFACSGHWFTESDNSLNDMLTLANDEKTYFLLVAHDITILKRQQEEVRTNALRVLLAEEELNEGMREMLAGAVHQLEGPINLITAAVGMLKRRAPIQGQEEPLYATLQDTLAKSTEVLDSLRQCIPKLDSPAEPIMPVNLNELIRDVLSISTQRFLTQGIVVNWQPALVLPSILGNVGRLRGMFKHLIDNAIESLSNSRKQRELRIYTTRDTDLVKVIIEDTGTGIPESLRFKVFEPFFTTKKVARRTGMGLSAVQDIVNCYAGTIHIDADYTDGCRVIVQFPTAHSRGVVQS